MNQKFKETVREALDKYNLDEHNGRVSDINLPKLPPETITAVLRGQWEVVPDSSWRKLAAALGINEELIDVAEISTSRKLNAIYHDAQMHSLVHGVIVPAGKGKTHKAKQYAATHSNVFVISCNEYFIRKSFLARVLLQMGYDTTGAQVHEMMDKILQAIRECDCPLLILDEADKLNDQVLSFFITLYNQLEGQCGIILQATDHLKLRIQRGIRLNRKGYNEIYSRLGRKFMEVHTSKEEYQQDVAMLCNAYGITDEISIATMVNSSEGDLRRVKKLIHATQQTRKKKD
jgi:DNA transposition AAA+ family ATPase